MEQPISIFCVFVTVFILLFGIVSVLSTMKNKECFDPIDSTKGYGSGVKIPDIKTGNLSIVDNFKVLTNMKMYNGETNTVTIENTTGGITGNIENIKTATAQTLNIKDFNILDIIYPVGCIYQSFENKNPKDLYGFGTWEPIKDIFLWAGKDSSLKGGSKTIKTDNLPSHTHSAASTSTAVNNHNHGYKGPSNKNGYPDRHGDTSGGGAWHQQYWAGNRWVGNNETTSDAGSHSHTISTTIGYTGGGKDYMPPYQTVYMWKRVADPVQTSTEVKDETKSSVTPPAKA